MDESKAIVSNLQSKVNNEHVYRWLKEKFNDLNFENIPDKGECIVFVQEKPGVIERTYFNSIFILSQAYSIYLFTDGLDTRKRFKSLEKLQSISDFVEVSSANKALPSLSANDKAMRFDVSMPAYLCDRNDQGCTYHLEITMTYESRK